jgi:hypothetical protein
VGGSDFDHTIGIRAGSPATPRELLLSLPAGTVAASHGGREAARLSERSADCPPGMVHQGRIAGREGCKEMREVSAASAGSLL